MCGVCGVCVYIYKFTLIYFTLQFNMWQPFPSGGNELVLIQIKMPKCTSESFLDRLHPSLMSADSPTAARLSVSPRKHKTGAEEEGGKKTFVLHNQGQTRFFPHYLPLGVAACQSFQLEKKLQVYDLYQPVHRHLKSSTWARKQDNENPVFWSGNEEKATESSVFQRYRSTEISMKLETLLISVGLSESRS